jgi:hypothetical protein
LKNIFPYLGLIFYGNALDAREAAALAAFSQQIYN